MDRQELIEEAEFVGQVATHNLRWMRNHPDRIDQRKKAYMRAYLQRMQYLAKVQKKEQKKNARLAGLTRFWTRIRSLTAIISKNWRSVNQKDGGTHESNL